MTNLAEEHSTRPTKEEIQANIKNSFETCKIKLVDYFNNPVEREYTDNIVNKVSSIHYVSNSITKIIGVPIAMDVNQFEVTSPEGGEKSIETQVKVILAYLDNGYTRKGLGWSRYYPGKIKTKTLRVTLLEEQQDKVDQLLSSSVDSVLEMTFETSEPRMSNTLKKLVTDTQVTDFKFITKSEEGTASFQNSIVQSSEEV